MNKKKFLEQVENVITNLISNLFWWVLTVLIANIFLWFPIIRNVFLSIENGQHVIPLYAFILAGISFIIIIVLLIIETIILIKYYKDTHIATDLILDKLEIELFFKDRETIFSYLSYNCIVNKENYSEFEKSIIWTGSGYNYTKITEQSGGCTLTDSTRKISPYSYTVNFEPKKTIGDVVYFKLETSVDDKEHIMTPIFSHMVKQQTNEFIIHLTVPKDFAKNVKANIYRDITRTIKVPSNINIQQQEVGGTLIQYSYVIKNPKLLNNYCIEWEFK